MRERETNKLAIWGVGVRPIKPFFVLLLIAAISAAVAVIGRASKPSLGPSPTLNATEAKDASARKAPVAPTDTKQTGEIQVYFAPCQLGNPVGIEHAFIGLLEGARKSIYGAFYELGLQDAADVLIERHRSGVDVRLVSDSDYEDRDAMRACLAAGIPVVFDERKPFMHDKFCIVDNEYVWTGSTNITENCMYRNDNNSLLLHSGKLAADYGVEFTKMFRDHRFGEPSTENVPYPEITVGDTKIECLFSPDDPIADRIVNQIQSTRSSIDFLAFSFTSAEIAKAMARRIDAGVRVRGVFDAKQIGAGYSQKPFLAEHGAEVYPDQNQYTMHDKVIILDCETVITGSYNFTKAAETKNDENVLIIYSPAIAQKYETRFEALLPK